MWSLYGKATLETLTQQHVPCLSWFCVIGREDDGATEGLSNNVFPLLSNRNISPGVWPQRSVLSVNKGPWQTHSINQFFSHTSLCSFSSFAHSPRALSHSDITTAQGYIALDLLSPGGQLTPYTGRTITKEYWHSKTDCQANRLFTTLAEIRFYRIILSSQTAIQQIVIAHRVWVNKGYLQNVAITVKVTVWLVGISIQFVISILDAH